MKFFLNAKLEIEKERSKRWEGKKGMRQSNSNVKSDYHQCLRISWGRASAARHIISNRSTISAFRPIAIRAYVLNYYPIKEENKWVLPLFSRIQYLEMATSSWAALHGEVSQLESAIVLVLTLPKRVYTWIRFTPRMSHAAEYPLADRPFRSSTPHPKLRFSTMSFFRKVHTILSIYLIRYIFTCCVFLQTAVLLLELLGGAYRQSDQTAQSLNKPA